MVGAPWNAHICSRPKHLTFQRFRVPTPYPLNSLNPWPISADKSPRGVVMDKLQNILETTLGSFLDLVQCDAGSVYTVRKGMLKFEAMITRSIDLRGVPDHLRCLEFAIDDSSIVGRTAAHRKPILLNSTQKTGLVSPWVGEILNYATRNI